MSTALALVPTSYAEMQSIAEAFAKSTLLPEALRGKAADVFVQIAAGAELGLPPMAAIRGVHIMVGKPILAADTMVAIVLGSGLAEYFMCVAESDTAVTYETKRKGAPVPQRSTWTWEDTKRAGLNTKETHRLFPRSMMKARCKAVLARDAYPDVLAGCYDPDEIATPIGNARQAPAPAPTIEAVDAEIVSEDLGLLAQIEHAESADLDALVPKINKLAKGSPERVAAMAAYKARKASLEPAQEATAP